MEIEKIKRKTVVEHVMEQMKEMIASGQFKIGDKIPTEQVLADMFGIARSSIREAIKIFHYLGVLESQTGRGTYVCGRGKISKEALTWSILLGENDIYEMVQLREVLEQAGLQTLAQEYAQNPAAVSHLIESLHREIENMKDAVARQDLEALILADYNFHGTIIQSSNNSLFTAIYRTLRAFMHEEIKKTLQGVHISKSIREHLEFVEAIKTANVDATLELLRTHIRRITEKLKETLEPKPLAGS